MPKVTQYLSVIGTAIVSLSTAYESMGPEAKTFFTNELAAIETEISTVAAALQNFATASTVGKITTGLSLLNVFGSVITFVETTFKNGEQFFAGDWPAVEAALQPVAGLFGVTLPASASTAVAPAAAPADPAPATGV